jgi:SAM-dependent methyltransferase
MDRFTIDAYDKDARSFADEWHAQPAPTDLHDLIRRFFHRGSTADIGCGSGREVAWLNAHGYPAAGYDPRRGSSPKRGGVIRICNSKASCCRSSTVSRVAPSTTSCAKR